MRPWQGRRGILSFLIFCAPIDLCSALRDVCGLTDHLRHREEQRELQGQQT